MNAARKLETQLYYIIASNPVVGWDSVYLEIPALSRADARELGARELARTKRGHWSVDTVLEAEGNAIPKCASHGCEGRALYDSRDFGIVCPACMARIANTVGT